MRTSRKHFILDAPVRFGCGIARGFRQRPLHHAVRLRRLRRGCAARRRGRPSAANDSAGDPHLGRARRGALHTTASRRARRRSVANAARQRTARRPPQSQYVGSLVVARTWGSVAAAIVTVLVLVTAFASLYGNLLGFSRIPFAAARDGAFLPAFARLHPEKDIPHVALFAVGALSLVASLFTLDQVIAFLTAGIVLVQGVAQVFALFVLRARSAAAPFRMPLFPLPALVALLGWSLAFAYTGTTAILLGVGWLAIGALVFLLTARAQRWWPFAALLLAAVFASRRRQRGLRRQPRGRPGTRRPSLRTTVIPSSPSTGARSSFTARPSSTSASPAIDGPMHFARTVLSASTRSIFTSSGTGISPRKRSRPISPASPIHAGIFSARWSCAANLDST